MSRWAPKGELVLARCVTPLKSRALTERATTKRLVNRHCYRLVAITWRCSRRELFPDQRALSSTPGTWEGTSTI